MNNAVAYVLVASFVISMLCCSIVGATIPYRGQFSMFQGSIDPPTGTSSPPNTSSPSNYYPVVITTVISAVIATVVGLIVASLKGLFKHRESSKMRRIEKNLLNEIEKAPTSNELRTLRKRLASEKATGSISKEQFDFLESRIDQRFEELVDK